MNDNVLAKECFTATANDEEYKISLSLIPSGAFQYGNGHALLYETEGYQHQLFDARYDKRFATPKTFHKYAYEFVKDQIRDEFTLTRTWKSEE